MPHRPRKSPDREIGPNSEEYLSFRDDIVKRWEKHTIDQQTLAHGIRSILTAGNEMEVRMIRLLLDEPELPISMRRVLNNLLSN